MSFVVVFCQFKFAMLILLTFSNFKFFRVRMTHVNSSLQCLYLTFKLHVHAYTVESVVLLMCKI